MEIRIRFVICYDSTSATDELSELLVDDSNATTLVGDSVTPRITSAVMAPGAHAWAETCRVNDARGS